MVLGYSSLRAQYMTLRLSYFMRSLDAPTVIVPNVSQTGYLVSYYMNILFALSPNPLLSAYYMRPHYINTLSSDIESLFKGILSHPHRVLQ